MEAFRPLLESNTSYRLTGNLFLRGLGLLYLNGFLILNNQFLSLAGDNGLLPAGIFFQRLREHFGSNWQAFWELPGIFFFNSSNTMMLMAIGLGLLLSFLLVLGRANAISMIGLWFLYLSFSHAGQVFYGYGWEMLLLELGFQGIFFTHPWKWNFSKEAPVVPIQLFFIRWTAFRLMFGAGMIKLRGDPCWKEATCLLYHFETQPLPNAMSWFFHHLPALFLKAGVWFNHFAELVAPWFLLGTRPFRLVAAAVIVIFQLSLILSGNLSFLNYLSILTCVACLDDGILRRIFSRWQSAKKDSPPLALSTTRIGTLIIFIAITGILSIQPTWNLFSHEQKMNASFDPFHLVNTYGAFGSVGKTRPEIILMGTRDSSLSDSTLWLEYEFKCKPGSLDRMPCLVAPYQYRLDWQVWFAAMQRPEDNPWLLHLIYKFLQNDEAALSLIAKNPFPVTPPQFIRVELYEYSFMEPGEKGWWKRKRLGSFLPPLWLEHESFLAYLGQYGWLK